MLVGGGAGVRAVVIAFNPISYGFVSFERDGKLQKAFLSPSSVPATAGFSDVRAGTVLTCEIRPSVNKTCAWEAHNVVLAPVISPPASITDLGSGAIGPNNPSAPDAHCLLVKLLTTLPSFGNPSSEEPLAAVDIELRKLRASRESAFRQLCASPALPILAKIHSEVTKIN